MIAVPSFCFSAIAAAPFKFCNCYYIVAAEWLCLSFPTSPSHSEQSTLNRWLTQGACCTRYFRSPMQRLILSDHLMQFAGNTGFLFFKMSAATYSITGRKMLERLNFISNKRG